MINLNTDIGTFGGKTDDRDGESMKEDDLSD